MPPTIRTIKACGVEAAGGAWDAVRVPRSAGLDALAILGHRSGAVLEDPAAPALYFFIPRGTVAAWDVDGTRILGADDYVVIPPDRRTQGPGPHWRICPVPDAWTTDATVLEAALRDAVTARAGRIR